MFVFFKDEERVIINYAKEYRPTISRLFVGIDDSSDTDVSDV